jgi:hypothetical protein
MNTASVRRHSTVPPWCRAAGNTASAGFGQRAGREKWVVWVPITRLGVAVAPMALLGMTIDYSTYLEVRMSCTLDS